MVYCSTNKDGGQVKEDLASSWETQRKVSVPSIQFNMYLVVTSNMFTPGKSSRQLSVL